MTVAGRDRDPNDFKDYDTAFIFIGQTSREEQDRRILGFGDATDKLISNFAKTGRVNGKKTVVVMSIPGAVVMPWKNDVDAIIVDFFSGE